MTTKTKEQSLPHPHEGVADRYLESLDFLFKARKFSNDDPVYQEFLQYVKPLTDYQKQITSEAESKT